jgi:glutamyl-tRNA synthetase
MQIITRFAPSPTGMLHIGGARTALFNYLFAKKNGGKMLLRIEDTDVQRSTNEAKDAILNGLKWLGIQHDEDVVFQMSRQNIHLLAAEKMVKNGSAYYAYDTEDELQQERAQAESQGKIYRYSRKWRDANLPIPSDIKPVIRLKNPDSNIVVDDIIHGTINFEAEAVDDLVLVRSDGTPTYMLAVVVDDIDMKITHIIRGDDHLSNTPKQVLIYRALGAAVPKFAHIPLIYDIEGKKLSKRRGSVATHEYKDMGYLPAALLNYLMQLGWSSKAENEIMSLQQAYEIFDVSQIGKSPSRFDFDKLKFINLQYIQAMDFDSLFPYIVPLIEGKINRAIKQSEVDRLRLVLDDLKKQSTLVDIANLTTLLLDDVDCIISEKSSELIANNRQIVQQLCDFLRNVEYNDFKNAFAIFLQKNGYKMGQVGPVLRSILIGIADSVAINSLVLAIGKEEILRRINLIAYE